MSSVTSLVAIAFAAVFGAWEVAATPRVATEDENLVLSVDDGKDIIFRRGATETSSVDEILSNISVLGASMYSLSTAVSSNTVGIAQSMVETESSIQSTVLAAAAENLELRTEIAETVERVESRCTAEISTLVEAMTNLSARVEAQDEVISTQGALISELTANYSELQNRTGLVYETVFPPPPPPGVGISRVVAGSFELVFGNQWLDAEGFYWNIPDAGTYLLMATTQSLLRGSANLYSKIRLFDATAGSVIPYSDRMHVEIQGGGSLTSTDNAAYFWRITVRAASRIQIQGRDSRNARRSGFVSNSNGRNELLYIKAGTATILASGGITRAQNHPGLRRFGTSWADVHSAYRWNLPSRGSYLLFLTSRTWETCNGYSVLRLRALSGAATRMGGISDRMYTEYQSKGFSFVNHVASGVWHVDISSNAAAIQLQARSTCGSGIGMQNDGNGWQETSFIKVDPNKLGSRVIQSRLRWATTSWGNFGGLYYWNLPEAGEYFVFATLRVYQRNGGTMKLRIVDGSGSPLPNTERMAWGSNPSRWSFMNHMITFAWKVTVRGAGRLLIVGQASQNNACGLQNDSNGWSEMSWMKTN